MGVVPCQLIKSLQGAKTAGRNKDNYISSHEGSLICPPDKPIIFFCKKQTEESWVSGQTCITTATEIQLKPRVLPIGRPKLVRQKSFEIDSSDEGGEKMKQGRLPPAITTTSSGALTDCIENQVWTQIDLTAYLHSFPLYKIDNILTWTDIS